MSTSFPVDEDNPLWTRKDFARALPPENMPPHILAAFPKTFARLEARKVPSGMLVAAFQDQNPGAQQDRLAA